MGSPAQKFVSTRRPSSLFRTRVKFFPKILRGPGENMGFPEKKVFPLSEEEPRLNKKLLFGKFFHPKTSIGPFDRGLRFPKRLYSPGCATLLEPVAWNPGGPGIFFQMEYPRCRIV